MTRGSWQGVRQTVGRAYQAVPLEGRPANPKGTPGRRKEFTDAEVAEIRRLRSLGWGIPAIAKQLGTGVARIDVVIAETDWGAVS